MSARELATVRPWGRARELGAAFVVSRRDEAQDRLRAPEE